MSVKRIRTQDRSGSIQEFTTSRVLFDSPDSSNQTPVNPANPDGFRLHNKVSFVETSDGTITSKDVRAGKRGYAKDLAINGDMAEAEIFPLLSFHKDDGDVALDIFFNKKGGGQSQSYEGYVEQTSAISKTLQLSVKPAATIRPSTEDQTIAKYQWLTGDQIIKGDPNLIAENIKYGVSIFGVPGDHKGGSAPIITVSNEGLITAESDGMTSTHQLSSEDDADFIKENIRSGKRVFGTFGELTPAPPWVAEGDGSAWTVAYMNPSIKWGSILRGEEGNYGKNKSIWVGASSGKTTFISGLFEALDLTAYLSGWYVLIYVQVANNDVVSITPIYSTKTHSITGPLSEISPGSSSNTTVTISAVAGWNTYQVALAPDEETKCLFFSDFGKQTLDPTMIATGSAVAFGDWVKRPTGEITLTRNNTTVNVTGYATARIAVPESAKPSGTLRITSNGTYDVSKYAEVIVDIATAGDDGENITVIDKSLVFDGDTSVVDKTLVLGSDAEVVDKTLVFSNKSTDAVVDDSGTIAIQNAVVDGKTIVLDNNVRVENGTLVL